MLHSGVLPQENLKHYTIGSYIQGSRCLKEVPILENDATIKGKNRSFAFGTRSGNCKNTNMQRKSL